MSQIASKPHREFFALGLHDAATRWQPVACTAGTIEEIILSDNLDPVAGTGSRTRVARWSAGALIDRPVVHDFHEEVFLFEGDLVVGCDAQGQGGERFEAHTFACRPPGALHGPFVSKGGCLMFEIQYYA